MQMTPYMQTTFFPVHVHVHTCIFIEIYSYADTFIHMHMHICEGVFRDKFLFVA